MDEDDFETKSDFTSAFRTPHLPPPEELRLLQTWELFLDLFECEGKLPSEDGSAEQLYRELARTKPQKATKGILTKLKRSDSQLNIVARRASQSRESLEQVWNRDAQVNQGLEKAFWGMLKDDHPDEILRRFLIQADWDPQRVLDLGVALLKWRTQEWNIDEIMRRGEEGFARLALGSKDPREREIASGFMLQLTKGTTHCRGTDLCGRPIITIKTRLSSKHDQLPESLQIQTIWMIETIRLMISPAVESATHIWDMKGIKMELFLLPIKFLIEISQYYYPGSVGLVLIHRAPLGFEQIWKLMKPLLTPKVAALVRFTRTVDDLARFIPRGNINKDFGGDDDWSYTYTPPQSGENESLSDRMTRKQLYCERAQLADIFKDLTRRWIRAANELKHKGEIEDIATLKALRDSCADEIRANYWRLDPFIRARSLYDRWGVIGARRAAALLHDGPRPTTQVAGNSFVKDELGSLSSPTSSMSSRSRRAHIRSLVTPT